MTDRVEAVVEALYDGLKRMDAPAVVSLFHPDAEIVTPKSLPWSTGHYSGLEGAMSYFTGALEMLDDNRFDVEEVRVSGDDWAAAIGMWYGHFRSGGEFNVRFVHFWTLRGGKVIKGEGISDTDGIVRASRGEKVG
ncbi:nuclear transport factor 2 family protein [Micromonospora sp. MS34]|uniref:nuclear transport factor 2 family protein n=1 Tax=Micromonospora sp. MS34 TaxID=3385971 RepID=UPI0039A34CCF